MFIENKYTKWYFNIIDRTKLRSLAVSDEYTESHHIIPKSLGGNNSKSNISILTAKEHFICHLLLTKMVSGNALYKMAKALQMIAVAKNIGEGRYVITSKRYEKIKKLISEETKKLWTPEKRKAQGIKAKNQWDSYSNDKKLEVSEKCRKIALGRKWSEKAQENRRNNCLKSAKKRKGKPWTEKMRAGHETNPYKPSVESNIKRSEKLRGRKTSIGTTQGIWFESSDSKLFLLSPIKESKNIIGVDHRTLKKLLGKNVPTINGWSFIRYATKQELIRGKI